MVPKYEGRDLEPLGELHRELSLGTIVTLAQHLSCMQAKDQEFRDERDRRYAEVAEARAEALKIKETADAKALELAAEIQSYKDRLNERLQNQAAEQRGSVSESRMAKEDSRARNSRTGMWAAVMVSVATALIALSSLVVYIATH